MSQMTLFFFLMIISYLVRYINDQVLVALFSVALLKKFEIACETMITRRFT